jgi:hypothetical protein
VALPSPTTLRCGETSETLRVNALSSSPERLWQALCDIKQTHHGHMCLESAAVWHHFRELLRNTDNIKCSFKSWDQIRTRRLVQSSPYPGETSHPILLPSLSSEHTSKHRSSTHAVASFNPFLLTQINYCLLPLRCHRFSTMVLESQLAKVTFSWIAIVLMIQEKR